MNLKLIFQSISLQKQSRYLVAPSASAPNPFHWCGLAARSTLTLTATGFQTQLGFIVGQHNLPRATLAPFSPHPALLKDTASSALQPLTLTVFAFECKSLILSSFLLFLSIHPSILPSPCQPLLPPRYCHASKFFAPGVTCFVIWLLHVGISMYI